MPKSARTSASKSASTTSGSRRVRTLKPSARLSSAVKAGIDLAALKVAPNGTAVILPETIQPTAPAARPKPVRREQLSATRIMPKVTRDDLEARVQELIALQGSHRDDDLIEDMIITSLKLVLDGTPRGELKIMAAALRELRYAFKTFLPYRDIRKISIFGSARTPPQAPEFKQAHAFAEEMVRRGYMVITGAGPGIMEAANGGAGRERSFGVNIRLPFEQSANPVIQGDKKLISFRYFFTRKLCFVKEASAIALFPGGFGTHDEGYEALTLVQTGKSTIIPIVFIDRPEGTYWREWAEYVAEHLLGKGLISPEDMNLFKVTDDYQWAAEEIAAFYRRYHSSRFVKDKLVIRLLTPLPAGALERIRTKFASILAPGDGAFQTSAALPEEMDQPELTPLPRLTFPFNRRDFGKLRLLIDEINRA